MNYCMQLISYGTPITFEVVFGLSLVYVWLYIGTVDFLFKYKLFTECGIYPQDILS